jgi:hypothetical protein
VKEFTRGRFPDDPENGMPAGTLRVMLNPLLDWCESAGVVDDSPEPTHTCLPATHTPPFTGGKDARVGFIFEGIRIVSKSIKRGTPVDHPLRRRQLVIAVAPRSLDGG